MLVPKKVKFRKQHRGKMGGVATRGATVAFGKFGLKAMDAHWITSRQIEAARRAITHHIKREGKVWIRIFPHQAVTSTPNETRMGGGKGTVSHYVATVKPGTVMFEMDGVPYEVAKEALTLAGHKLPIRTKVVVRGI